MHYRDGFVGHDFHVYTLYYNNIIIYNVLLPILLLCQYTYPTGNRPLNSQDVYRFLFNDKRHNISHYTNIISYLGDDSCVPSIKVHIGCATA